MDANTNQLGMIMKKRSSNIELFRIIVMWLIVAHHYIVNSKMLSIMSTIPDNINVDILYIFGAFGKTGINCFVIITSYYMCERQISFKKFLKLIIEVLFYNVIIWYPHIIYTNSFSLQNVIKPFCIIEGVHVNFMACFLIFYLTIPYLNVLIHNIGRIQHLYLIILCLFIYTLMPLIGHVLGYEWVNMNHVSWYITLFIITSYLRLYPLRFLSNNMCCGLLLFFSVVMAICSVYILRKMNIYPYRLLVDANAIFALLIGVFSFFYFLNMNVKYNKIINIIASCTFGIYLIHNNPVVSKYLWENLFDGTKYVEIGNSTCLIHAFFSVCAVFVSCAFIDIIRQILFDNLSNNNQIDKIAKILDSHIKRFNK